MTFYFLTQDFQLIFPGFVLTTYEIEDNNIVQQMLESKCRLIIE